MLDKTFNPQEVESRIYQQWVQSGAFHVGRRPDADPFCIVIPPPNVTGRLHIGHALNNTLQDAVTRFQRMRGKDVLWQPGTDHAGIATQLIVERQLAEKQMSRLGLGREKFLEEVWKWKAESGGMITRQLRRLGASPDWAKERFTMEDINWMLSKISYASGQSEYFNNPVTDGTVFKEITWGKVPPLSAFKFLVAYGDPAPSNKEAKGRSGACYKTIVLVGQAGGRFYIITCFLQHVVNMEFVRWYYDLKDYVKDTAFQPLVFEQLKAIAITIALAVIGTTIIAFITKAIVEAHGGKIEVDSHPNEWIEFRFTLPVAVEAKT